MTAVAKLRRLLPASMRRPGALGIVFTPTGRVVLVEHTYLAGWHPPGGGRKRGEDAAAAVIRELREEIGLETWSNLTPIVWPHEALDIFVVKGAIYRPHRSIEIAAVRECDVGELPRDVSPRLIEILRRLGFEPALAEDWA